MAFARTETGVLNHPKFVGLDPGAIGLWALGNAYCWDQLTDGFIPAEQVPRLLSWVPPKRVMAWAAALVAATCNGRFPRGLWESVPGGYQVHDWLDHNPPASKIIADRDAARERMRQRRGSRERSSEHTGEHTKRSQERSGARSRNVRDRDVDVELPPTPFGNVQANTTPSGPTCAALTPSGKRQDPGRAHPAHPDRVVVPNDGVPCYPSAELRAQWIHVEDGCPRTEHLHRFPPDLRWQCPAHRSA